MFDRRRIAGANRDRIPFAITSRRTPRGFKQVVSVWRIGVDLTRQSCEFGFGRQVDQRDGAFQQLANILRTVVRLTDTWPLWITRRCHAFPVCNEDLLAVPTQADGCWIPSCRNETDDFAIPTF